jgi:hypothetical protein
MTDEEQIKLSFRIGAIEYLLNRVLVSILRANEPSPENVVAALDVIARDAGAKSFPALDPQVSAKASAEWQTAVDRLNDLQKKMLWQQIRAGGATLGLQDG